MIALGGCQIGGFQVPEKNSFLQVFSELSGREFQYKAPYFQITNTSQLRRILDLKKPAVALIQLGNAEFQVSFRNLFHQDGQESGSGNVIDMKPGYGSPLQQNSSAAATARKSRFSLPAVSNLIAPLLWRVIERRHDKDLQELKKIMSEYSQTTFIVLSPMPYENPAKNKVYSVAGRWLNRMFGNLSNFRYIDLIRLLPAHRQYSQDSSYQAARHRVLAKIISHYCSLSPRPAKYLQAV